MISELTGGRAHTELPVRIGGRSYVIGAEEGYCPAGNARIVDVEDEARPVEVASIDLEINTLPQCARQVNRNGDVLLYMSHYVGVDDPNDAKLLFVTWYASGPARVRHQGSRSIRGRWRTTTRPSVRAPAAPTTGRPPIPRYDPRTGQIWFGSKVNGFNVVELHPSLRPRRKGQPVSAAWSVAATTAPAVASDSARAVDDGPPPPQLCTLR